MIDTKVKVNGKTVGEYDLINEPCVKKINGEGPDDNGNVAVETDGPTINGGYDTMEPTIMHPVTNTIGSSNAYVTCYDPELENYLEGKVGQECSASFDGVEYKTVITRSSNGFYHFGDTEFSEFPFHLSFGFDIDRHSHVSSLDVSDASVSHTAGFIKPVSVPVAFADKYIPDTIARKKDVYTKDEVYTKDKVYTRDETYTKDEQTKEITWDGTTDGKDSFNIRGSDFYKVSDEIIPFDDVKSIIEDGRTWTPYKGINCYGAGNIRVVLKAGECFTSVENGDSFTAPSAGVYFWRNYSGHVSSASITYYSRYQTGLIVNSPTKKWKLTVDDSGTISATEITE